MNEKYWIGDAPETCDICNGRLQVTFIDGKTIHGPWAIMCLKCFLLVGMMVGPGYGQRYEESAKGWKKVQG